jgi:hypothetical protein
VTQVTPQPSLNSSRLVRFLGGLGVADVAVSHEQFARRLGELIDLPDSIKLSAVHADLATSEFEQSCATAHSAREDFLRVRNFMLHSVSKSFAPGSGSAGIRLPGSDDADTAGDDALREAYLRFYISHQREIGFKVRNLHTRTREALAGHSPELARLCTLDAAIGTALSGHTRRYFTAVPKLLDRRFRQLLAPPGDAAETEADQRVRALTRFQGEMRELLLAEIEARLLPVLGLIEALEETMTTTKI